MKTRAAKFRGFREPSPLALKLAKLLAGFPVAEKYLVGVSGGRDSVALLHLLVRLGFHNLVVCHLDHCLRGSASSTDARWVQQFAKKVGVAVVLEKADVAGIAKTDRLSVETAARNARHQFFAKVARAENCSALFLAHHADDQVETFLFNLFRGAGTDGLGAMRMESTRRINDIELRILRPLLGVWREEIDDYVRANRLRFREDATNQSLENTRSIMRHRILPMIAENFGREVKPAIWRAAEVFSAQNEWMKQSLSLLEARTAELSVPELRSLPTALQRFAIHQWLRWHAVREVGFDLVEAIRELLPSGARKAKINLPGARHVRRREKKLFLT